MKPAVVPRTGLALVKSANATVHPPTHKPTQVMAATFEDDMVKELVKTTRNGAKPVKMSFGKMPVCCRTQLPRRDHVPVADSTSSDTPLREQEPTSHAQT
jgi:hypothetical protein